MTSPPVSTVPLGHNNRLVIRWLLDGRSINYRECARELDVLDLAKRIHQLRALGYDIRDSWEHIEATSGQKTRCKRYWLHGAKDE